MWIAFLVALFSGALLFLADVEAFALSPIFCTKMALVALLVVNVVHPARLDAALRRGEAAPEAQPDDGFRVRRWRRRRAGAIASALLWFGLVFVGTALASH